MRSVRGEGAALQEAVTDFQQARDEQDLWARLHHHLAPFGFTGLLYGCEPILGSKGGFSLLLSSLTPGYMDDKLSNDLFYVDEFVTVARHLELPILWSDTSRLEGLSPLARKSLDIDWDYKITTGVTLPMRFANGVGGSAIGCHIPEMSWEEFDRLWAEAAGPVAAIVQAFDLRLRQDHLPGLISLSPRERECLLWLAKGLAPAQVAYRLNIHEKTIEKQLKSARDKLGAINTVQAIARAMALNLIDP